MTASSTYSISKLSAIFVGPSAGSGQAYNS